MKNKIITFEGIDGSGKTTIASAVKKELESRGQKVEIISELGKNSTVFLGIKPIRYKAKFKELIGSRTLEWNWLSRFDEELSWKELKIIMKLRKNIYNKITKPLLKQGTIVIYDRFIWSTLVYQCSKLGKRKQKMINKIVNKPYQSWHNFFIKCNKDILLKRAEERYNAGTIDLADPVSVNEIIKTAGMFDQYHYLMDPIVLINDNKKQLDKNIRNVIRYIEVVL